MNPTLRVKLSLMLNYFVFAILLNSVGTVILQVQNNFGISESSASILEAFKDLSIAITSFLIASYIVRIGYKRAMLLALILVTAACLAMPFLPSFWMTKVLFATVGVSFALIKVSVFATIGIITKDEKEHASFMNFLESFFMIGILSGYFVFSAFVDDANPASTAWLNAYFLLAGISFAAFLLLLSTPLDESEVQAVQEKPKSFGEEFAGMFSLLARPLVMVFLVSAFVYVLVEQGIMSWLPSFNSKILNLPTSLSIEMAAILAGSTALGRFLAGFVLRKLEWFPVIAGSLVLAAVLVMVSLPLASGIEEGRVITGWFDAPLAAFVFPMIGLCLAPIYPAINSVILSALPVRQHAPMSGLIVVFSALGGTTGSMVTGYMFEHYDGQTAFYMSLIPLTILLVSLFAFNRMVKK
ncbi:MAG: sugar MFS transporter [Chitinophagales bacterium]